MYLPNDGWRRSLFLAGAPRAGGLTHIGLSPHAVFLSEADFETGTLVYDGRRIAPPLGLACFLRREVSQPALGRALGPLRFHTGPAPGDRGQRADLAALGAPDRDDLASALASGLNGRALWDTWGYYARPRLLADWILETQDYVALMQSDWTESETMTAFIAGHGRTP